MNIRNCKSCALIIAFLTALILLLADSLSAQMLWYKLNSGTTADIEAVCFRDSDWGCAVGENIILHTTNGGLDWRQALTPFPGYNFTIRSVCYSNSSIGWLAGEAVINPQGQHYSVILLTVDGGHTWQNTYLMPSKSGLNSICFWNTDAGWAVGGNVILHTTNLGTFWLKDVYHNGNGNFDFKSVCFVNSGVGYIAGEVYENPPGIQKGVILKTVNGGANWVEIYPRAESGLNSICFCSIETGWVAGGGIIKKTTDGGITWITKKTSGGLNSVYNIKHVYFTDLMNGWASGGYYNTITWKYYKIMLATADGGENWTEQIFESGGNEDYLLNSVYFINQETGWAAGDNGVILKTIPDTYIGPGEIKTVPDSYSLYQNYPNPFNPATKIKFEIPSREGWMRNADGVGLVILKVYDILGKEVATLVNEKLQPGTYDVTFDGSDLSSGVYFYHLLTKDFIATKKLILLK